MNHRLECLRGADGILRSRVLHRPAIVRLVPGLVFLAERVAVVNSISRVMVDIAIFDVGALGRWED